MTPLNQPMFEEPDAMRGALAGIPAGRLGTAEEVTRTAPFLASDAADYVVGHSLIADGGYVVAG
ncbi:MAG: SDR family oxidoreductase [Pseudomonadota bacterium]